MGVLDVILLLLVGAALTAAVVSLIRGRKKKKGCSGSCQGCPYSGGSGCPSRDISE